MARILPPAAGLAEPLLATKLMPPPLRRALVDRQRLHERLGRALEHTLTLIVAPAGSGKTTLLAGWLASFGHEHGSTGGTGAARALPRRAWLSLDEADDDPARFWRYLLAAVARVTPEVTGEAAALLGTAPAEAVVVALLNALANDGAELLLALDDYHCITTPAIHAGMALLIERAPPGLRVVLAGRSAPPLPLERLRVRGRMFELGAVDLRFTPEEAAALLADTMGLDLGPEVVAALVRRTEGWGAGLVLAALTAHGSDDPTANAHSFGGASPLVLDYVTAEVLRGQPDEVRDFLLHTAPLDRLCAELCDAVLGAQPRPGETGRSQRLLEQIERAGLFLVPLDAERRWFRYHHLFAGVLRARVEQANPALLRTALRRAAAWLATQGLAEEAIGYALRAEAWDEAARLVAEAGADALLRGETATLRGWLDALPPGCVRAEASLALLDGWLHVLAGDIAGAGERVKTAEAAEIPEELADELRALRAIVAVMDGHLSGGLELAALPPARLPRGAFVGAVQAIAQGLHAELGGAVEAAAAAYTEAARLAEAAGSLLVSFIARCQLGEVQILQGRLRDAEATYSRADELCRRDPATATVVGESALIGLGATAYERGELARAEALLSAGLAGSALLGDIAAFEAHTILAQIAAASGAFERATAHLDTAEGLVRTARFDALLPRVGALRAQINVRRGELGAAALWLETVERYGQDALPGGLQELVDLERARVLTALGRHDEALALLDETAAQAEAGGRNRALIECLAARAVALAGRGRLAAARAAFAAAVAMARPEGYVTVLAGAEHALAAATAAPRSPVAAPYGGHDLTERELEVLRLIAEGYGNDAIAARLVVAQGTVKKHINRIFAKLDAASRTQAIVRARMLGLLD